MHFKHINYDLGYADLSSETLSTGRTYETPDGERYPSITTVLSVNSKKSIEAWRKRVGNEEADRISYRASTRGTAVHEICEKYVDNDPDWDKFLSVDKTTGVETLKKRTPDLIASFMQLKPILDERLTTVYAQEVPLYSHYLGVAGRVDCVGIFDGKLSIIDYKTSKKKKPYKFVTNYFMQEAFYAIAWEEITKEPITQLVTIISVDGDDPQVFIEHRDDWSKSLIDTITKYKEDMYKIS